MFQDLGLSESHTAKQVQEPDLKATSSTFPQYASHSMLAFILLFMSTYWEDALCKAPCEDTGHHAEEDR